MEPTPKARRKPTIRDVAAAAGVSYGTVSRVLNGGHWVSDDAREAVEQAIRTTGYIANHAARALATGKADSVAFLLSEPQNLLFSDPTYALLLRGAAEALAGRGMALVLLVAGTEAEKKNAMTFISGGHVDGVLLISSHEADPMMAALLDSGVPTVASGTPLGRDGEFVTVSVDEAGSARAATAYLRDIGRRRIAMIAGPDDTPGGRFRVVGYSEVLGNDFDPRLVERGDFGTESGITAMSAILDRAPDVDAVFAASDQMAIGAITTLQRSGRRVPEDVAVIGFDDSGPAAAFEPALTTMRQPWDEISELMVASLCELIAGRRVASTVLPTTLVVRDSA